MLAAGEESGDVEIGCSSLTGRYFFGGISASALLPPPKEYDRAQAQKEHRARVCPIAHFQDVESPEKEYRAGDHDSSADDPGTGLYQEVRRADDDENYRPRLVERKPV